MLFRSLPPHREREAGVVVIDPVQAATDLAEHRKQVRVRRWKRAAICLAAAAISLGVAWTGWALFAHYLIPPGERELVFASDRDGDWDIYVRRPNGDVEALTVNSHDDRNPVWHPNGERSEEHTSELQSQAYLVCRLLLEKKNYYINVIAS